MTKFKVGDTVEVLKTGQIDSFAVGTIRKVVRADDENVWLQGCTYPWSNPGTYLKLVGERAETHFILQYELDEDPFETFATMKEVEDRIKELAKRSDLKRESIKVYEIAKTYDVKLETRVIFGGHKVKLTPANTGAKMEAVKRAVKRGRPFKFACPECDFKGKSGRQLGAHKRYNH